MAVKTIDVLDGIPLDGAHVLTAPSDRPELHILAGDRLIAREADTAEPGRVVVVLIDGEAALRRYEDGQAWRVIGLVVGVVRGFGDVG